MDKRWRGELSSSQSISLSSFIKEEDGTVCGRFDDRSVGVSSEKAEVLALQASFSKSCQTCYMNAKLKKKKNLSD